MVAMRWTDQLVGIVSTLILARLLVPEDFGIVAMASLVVGLIDVMFDLGVNVALIHRDHPTQEHYDTAWTLRLIEGFLAGIVIFTCAPLAASYFRDSRVEDVLRALAAGPILAALENIWIVTFQKEMRFGLDFRFAFTKRIVGFLSTMILALTLGTYWALILGGLSGRLAGVLLSYRMHQARPRLSVAKWRDILSVSQWMLLRGLLNYLNANADKMLLGGRASPSIMGGYTLGSQIAGLPTTELVAPLNRVLFPAFVRARGNIVEFRHMFLLAQGVQCLIAIPLCVGLAVLAPELVMLALGSQWTFITIFIQIFALTGVLQTIGASPGYLLMATGRFAAHTAITVIQLVALFVLALSLEDAGGTELALARFGSVLIGTLLLLALVRRTEGIPLLHIFAQVWRPVLSAGLAALLVTLVGAPPAFGPFELLLVKATLGTLVYLSGTAFSWILSGRPEGGERYLLAKLLSAFPRRPASFP